MSFVIGVFEPADDRSCRTDEFGQLPLGQTGGGTKIINLTGNVVI